MVQILDLENSELTLQRVIDSLNGADAVFIRQHGKVIARLDATDKTELEDEIWALQPEQAERGRLAREEFARGETIPLERVKRELLDE